MSPWNTLLNWMNCIVSETYSAERSLIENLIRFFCVGTYCLIIDTHLANREMIPFSNRSKYQEQCHYNRDQDVSRWASPVRKKGDSEGPKIIYRFHILHSKRSRCYSFQRGLPIQCSERLWSTTRWRRHTMPILAITIHHSLVYNSDLHFRWTKTSKSTLTRLLERR